MLSATSSAAWGRGKDGNQGNSQQDRVRTQVKVKGVSEPTLWSQVQKHVSNIHNSVTLPSPAIIPTFSVLWSEQKEMADNKQY